jgi:hypothetical protein
MVGSMHFDRGRALICVNDTKSLAGDLLAARKAMSCKEAAARE